MKKAQFIARPGLALAAALAVNGGFISNALAQLPAPVTPTTAPAAGNFIDWMKWWFKDNVDTMALIAMAIIFLIAGYIIFQKLVEVRRGRAEMSELFVQGGASAAVAVAASFFLNQAVGVIA